MVRLGLTLAPSNTIRLDDLIALAQEAEHHGYDSIWVPETWGADAGTVLASLALNTSRIKLAAGVFNVFSRSAALIAQTAATLQHLSRGRFILGLGASGPGVVERWHGMPYARPVERTRTYVEIIKLALAGERVDHAGLGTQLSGFRLANPPDAPVSIYIAALGPRNVRLAGEIADGWLPIFAPRGQLGVLRDELVTGAEDAGRDASTIDIAAFLPAAVGPRAERLLRQQLAYYVGAMGTFYASFLSRMGYAQEVATVRERWTGGDRLGAVAAVPDDLLATATLGTDPGTAAVRLADYRMGGLGLPILALPHGCTVEGARQTVRALAPQAP